MEPGEGGGRRLSCDSCGQSKGGGRQGTGWVEEVRQAPGLTGCLSWPGTWSGMLREGVSPPGV